MRNKYSSLFSLTFLLIVCFSACYGQSNLTQGYIVTLKGDTIHGKIDDRDWGINPRKISFQTNGTLNTYTANDILAFGTSNKDTYEKYITRIDVSSLNSSEMIPNSPAEFRTDTVFLRLLVKSKTSLFYLKDENAKEHFFTIVNGGMQELLFQTGLVQRNGTKYLATNEYYKEQLKEIMLDQTKMTSLIDRTKYDIVEMTNLFNKYNQSIGLATKVLSKNDKTKFEFEAIAGMSMNNMNIQGTYYDRALTASKLQNSIKPVIGGSMIVYLSRNRKQWSLDNELNYTSYTITTTGRYKLDSYHDFSDVYFKGSYLKLVNIVLYQYPKGTMRPYFGFGVSNGYALTSKNGYYSYNNIAPQNSGEKTIIPDADIRKYELGMVLSAGISYNKFRLELRYDRTNGVSSYVNASTTVTGTQLMVRYRL